MPTPNFILTNRFARCISLCILVAFLSACQSRPTVVYPDGDKAKRIFVNAPKSTSDFNPDALGRN